MWTQTMQMCVSLGASFAQASVQTHSQHVHNEALSFMNCQGRSWEVAWSAKFLHIWTNNLRISATSVTELPLTVWYVNFTNTLISGDKYKCDSEIKPFKEMMAARFSCSLQIYSKNQVWIQNYTQLFQFNGDFRGKKEGRKNGRRMEG